MKSILYFSWWNFQHARPWRRPNNLLRFEKFFDFDQKFIWGKDGVSTPRFGKDTSVFKVHKDKDFAEIDFDGLSENFETVTDKRSIELLNITNSYNKKLAFLWSGGIDSTLALSSIIKNWQKQDWEKVIIFLNDYSIVENPLFFHNFISSKFQYTFYNDYAIHPNTDQYIITDGQHGDQLWKTPRHGDYELFYDLDHCSNTWINEKDNFFNFLIENRNIDKMNARSIIDRIDVNVNSFDCPVKTLDDVLQWIDYNFGWQSRYITRYKIFFDEYNSKSLRDFKNFYFPWFGSVDYQRWAWSDQTRNELSRTSYKDNKQAAKKYIFDISKDIFYLNYKTKMGSTLIDHTPPAYIIFSDGTMLDTTEQNYEELFSTYLLGY